MEYYKNRCWGCHYYGGTASGSEADSIAICEKGYIGIRELSGCSDFQADSSAYCLKCFYYSSQNSRDICSVYNLSAPCLSGFPGENGFCPSFAQKEYYSEPIKKSGCFVTTAICEILGKDDNCYELQVLRQFRDTKLLTHIDFKHLVEQYYEISPKFVSIIKTHPKQEEFSQHILTNYIQNIINYIESNQDTEAIQLYQDMLSCIEKSDNEKILL